MQTDPQVAYAVGATGVVVILAAAAFWFLAPAGRRPRTDHVRAAVRQRMQPVMIPASPEVNRHAQRVALDTYPRGGLGLADPTTGRPYAPAPNWATDTVLIPDRPQRAVIRPPQAHVAAELPRAVAAHIGDTATPGSLAALAAVGPGSLLAPGTPEHDRAEYTEDEIETARWAAEFAALGRRLSDASRAATIGIESGLSPFCLAAYRDAMARQYGRRRQAAALMREWTTDERRAVVEVAATVDVPVTDWQVEIMRPRPVKQTPAQAKRARKKTNAAKGVDAKLRGKLDRVLVEVGA